MNNLGRLRDILNPPSEHDWCGTLRPADPLSVLARAMRRRAEPDTDAPAPDQPLPDLRTTIRDREEGRRS